MKLKSLKNTFKVLMLCAIICTLCCLNTNNIYAATSPDPVKNTCRSCESPTLGWFTFGYLDDKKYTIFVPLDPNSGGIVLEPGWGTFIIKPGGGTGVESSWTAIFIRLIRFTGLINLGNLVNLTKIMVQNNC